ASLLRQPVVAARAQALDHPYSPGATIYGRSSDLRVSPDWAAWANGVAVRELDFHDTFLAADYSHPGDNIPHCSPSPSTPAPPGRTWCVPSPPPTRCRSP